VSERPLLERGAELEDIELVLNGAAAGHGAVLTIEGAAGIGKSRLLGTAAEMARIRGFGVLAAGGHDLEVTLPWGVAERLIEPGLCALDPDLRAGLLAGPARRAATLFGGGERTPVEDPVLAMLHALYMIVVTVGEDRPLALLVDDCHWTDEPSLGFLRYLGFRITGLPVAMIASARPALAGHDWAALAGLPAARGHTLAPLSEQSIAELARQELGDGVRDEVVERIAGLTGGNPFLAGRLLAAVAGSGAEVTLYDVERAAPAAAAREVLHTLRAHGEHSVLLAEALATFGERAEPALAARLAGMSTADALTLADELMAADILASSSPLSFAHPLLHEAVYAGMAPGRRAAGHVKAAQILRESGAAPERVAEQLRHAPPEADPATVEALRAGAAAAVLKGAPLSAVAYLERALAEPPAPDERAAVLLELADARAAAAQPGSVEALREALDETRDPASRGRLELRLGWALHQAGRPGEAAHVFEHALAKAGGDELRAALEAGYLTTAMLDAATTCQAQSRIRELLARNREPRGAADRELIATLAAARVYAGDPHHEVVALAERALDGGKLIEDRLGGSQPLWHVVGCLSWCDHFDRALEIADLVTTPNGHPVSVSEYAMGCYARSWPLLWTGRVEASVADARTAVEIWQGGSPSYLPAAVYWLVHGLIDQGQVDEARGALAALSTEEWAGTAFEGVALAARARVHAAEQDHRAALADWLACGDYATKRMLIFNPSIMPWRSEAAIEAAKAGDPRAEKLASEAVQMTERFGADRARGHALRAAGLVQGGTEGLRLLERSSAVLERSGARLEYARSLVALGAAERRAGKRTEARSRLQTARRLATELGATAIADEAATELAAAGGRVRRAQAQTGPKSLTASELRVAQHAVRGLSNRAIAGALFVTVKAVEWHLSNAYRKLGISGRAELESALDPD